VEFLTEKEDDWGPPVALSDKEIDNLFKLAKVSKSDVFYDLGSGDGEIVRTGMRKYHVKYSNGIEADIKRFLESVEHTRDEFSKKQLAKIDLWRVYFQDYDFSDATLVYNGMYSFGWDEEIEAYNKMFEKSGKSFKIIKRDLPLIPYMPIRAHRDKRSSWFFLMKTPLQKYKVKSVNKWSEYVLETKNSSINDVYKYYYQKLKDRFLDDGSSLKEAEKEAKVCLRNLKKEIKTNFKF